MLTFNNFSKQYKNKIIFQNVNIVFEPGKRYGITGNNGCGKTTLLNCISGLQPYSGDILLENRSINKLDIIKRAKAGIGYLTQEHCLLENETVKMNLLISAEIYFKDKMIRQNAVQETIELYCLQKLLKQKIKTLSGGEKKRLELGLLLMNREAFKVFLLDEPLTGIDKENLEFIKRTLLSPELSGHTILIVDHNLTVINEICTERYVVSDYSLVKL